MRSVPDEVAVFGLQPGPRFFRVSFVVEEVRVDLEGDRWVGVAELSGDEDDVVATKGVQTGPGATTFTRIPRPASDSDSAFENVTSPPFVVA